MWRVLQGAMISEQLVAMARLIGQESASFFTFIGSITFTAASIQHVDNTHLFHHNRHPLSMLDLPHPQPGRLRSVIQNGHNLRHSIHELYLRTATHDSTSPTAPNAARGARITCAAARAARPCPPIPPRSPSQAGAMPLAARWAKNL